MNNIVTEFFKVNVGVIFTSAVVTVILSAFMWGTGIWSDFFQDTSSKLSGAGQEMMHAVTDVRDLDGANLYKILEANRHVVTDWCIYKEKSDGSKEYITDWDSLLQDPTQRYVISISGDPSIGYIITASASKEV